MDLRRFVQVNSEFAGGGGKTGTGYLLGGDRILTAGHVVKDAIRVEILLDGDQGQVVTVPVEETLWCQNAEDGIDAAVLRCQPVRGIVSSFCLLSGNPLPVQQDWESRGCARTASLGTTVADRMEALNGTAPAVAKQAHRFTVTVEAPPENVEYLQGISGAPIFVGGRIFGVIRQARSEFTAWRVDATPMHQLLLLPDFRDALGVDLDRWNVTRDRLTSLLSREPEAARAIQSQECWREVLEPMTEREVVSFLCERTTVEELLDVLHGAHKSLMRQRSVKAAQVIEDILAHLLPMFYDRHLLAPFSESSSGALILQIPVATPTVAEIVMAAEDRQPYSFRPLEDQAQDPQPFSEMGKIPEVGLDLKGEFALDTFLKALAMHLVPESQRVRVLQTAPQERNRKRGELIDIHLRLHKKRGDGRSRYLLCSQEFLERHKLALRQLQECVRELKIIQLTGGDVDWTIEIEEIEGPLRFILVRDRKTDEEPN